MKQIKNIVFDFGGVVIGLDREQAVKAFERIGVREADSLLGKYHQQGIFQEVENGNIDAETFRCELSKNLRERIDLSRRGKWVERICYGRAAI